jgi:hypothetical protein
MTNLRAINITIIIKNNIMKNSIKLSLMILTILFMSCSKDGVDGAIGPKGENGSNGTDGNANVTSIILRDVVLPSTSNTTFDVPELTQEILDEGLIVAYFDANRTVGTVIWRPFPDVSNNGKLAVLVFQVGSIVIQNTYSTSITAHLKFVLIEGN